MIGFTWGMFWVYLGIALGLAAAAHSISLFAWYRKRKAESTGRRAPVRGTTPAGKAGSGGRIMPGWA